MKFQKQLQWQLVPEWRDSYCDYKDLKKELRKIKRSGPARRSWMPGYLLGRHRRKIEIVVHSRGGHAAFETELDSAASENERAFFRALDLQLGIVNGFYIAREGELESRARMLLLQLENDHHSVTGDARKSSSLINAVADLCRQLSLLRNYSMLNRMAFWKITKKFDKITGQTVSSAYMRAVETSYFRTSHKLLDTMDQVNSIVKHTFIKGWYYSSSSSRTSFYFGLVTGSCLGLLAAFVLLHILSRRKRGAAVLTTFSIFGTLALFVLHLCTYACNVYFWQRARIHYASMLEMAPGADLKHQDIFLISLVLAAILLLGMVLYLGADILAIQAVTTNDIPLFVIVVVVALLVIPYNYFYKPARYGLLRLIARTIFSPLSEVRFADFFFADQLASQASALKDLGFSVCYHGGRVLAGNTAVCFTTTYQCVILLLPQWWRILQCLRKWHDGDQVQLANAAKYLCGMLSLMAKFAYARTGSTLWFVSFIVVSLCTTMYQLYWDLVMDWGLLQRRSRNAWLRDELILTKKAIYIASMVVNSFLRFAWLHSFLSFRAGTDQQVVQFMFAFLEVLRRGLWNFFRLENEHSRMAKTIPL